MKYLINKTTKQVYGYDEDQEELYQAQLAAGDFAECRLPEQYEVWDDELNDWAVDEQAKQEAEHEILIATARNLFDKTNAFDNPAFKRRFMTPEQVIEFDDWREQLLDVIYDGATTLPETPDFIKNML